MTEIKVVSFFGLDKDKDQRAVSFAFKGELTDTNFDMMKRKVKLDDVGPSSKDEVLVESWIERAIDSTLTLKQVEEKLSMLRFVQISNVVI